MKIVLRAILFLHLTNLILSLFMDSAVWMVKVGKPIDIDLKSSSMNQRITRLSTMVYNQILEVIHFQAYNFTCFGRTFLSHTNLSSLSIHLAHNHNQNMYDKVLCVSRIWIIMCAVFTPQTNKHQF